MKAATTIGTIAGPLAAGSRLRALLDLRYFAALTALLLVGGAFGCSTSSSSQHTETPEATGRPSATSVSQPTAFCLVGLPDNWRNAFTQGKISLATGDRFVAVAVAPDASRVFGDLYSDDWSGVVSVSARGSVSRISQFVNPA